MDGSDVVTGCGSICKASLLTLAGFGTLAVYNGLGTGEVGREGGKSGQTSTYLILSAEKEAVAGKLSRRMDSVKSNKLFKYFSKNEN